jgi:hypothetical protein
MHSVPDLAESAFCAGFEHLGDTCHVSKLITGSSGESGEKCA